MSAPVDHAGQQIRLGRELGRGGEGAVFELPDQPRFVAKVYHQPPDAAKQDKLRLMAAGVDARLREYAAWPEQTLHRAGDGAVIGFTMQRIDKRLPVHMVYSPAQRRELFPKARWDFLLFVARNLAAAFDTLHDHGHVLGDVNQGNALVGDDSRVILIDCDSFQVQAGDALHRCGVGVGHFTPPELQGITSFDEVTRTANHDNFGLALLIFHLLMGGRHPYSGVPQSHDVGHSLESDIREFRYAYARDAASRLLLPPPRSVPIDALPPEIAAMFESAFLDRGVTVRPTAHDWLTALDAAKSRLTECAREPMHVHARHRTSCPWCDLDRHHVRLFGNASGRVTVPSKIASEFDIKGMRQRLEQLPEQQPFKMLRLPAPGDTHHLTPVMGWKAAGIVTIPAVIGMAGVPFLFDAEMHPLIGFAAGSVAGLFLYAILEISKTPVPRGPGDPLVDAARERFLALERDLMLAIQRANVSSAELREALASRLDAFEQEIAAQEAARSGGANLRAFLGAQLIDRGAEDRIPLTDRIRLRGFGIESAADFDRARLAGIRFRDPDTPGELMAWKISLVQQFQKEQKSRKSARSGGNAAVPDALALSGQSIQRDLERLYERQASSGTEDHRWSRSDEARRISALRAQLIEAHEAWVRAARQ